MFSTVAKLESVVEGKTGHFIVDHDASTKVVKEMLCHFIGFISQLEETAKQKEQEIAAEKAAVDEANLPVTDISQAPCCEVNQE